MEPQINYSGTGVPVHKKSGCLKKGCFGIAGLVILLIIAAAAAMIFVYPSLSGKFDGDLLDMSVVPQKDGTQKLWILTDASSLQIDRGNTSRDEECNPCRTWTYVYDPVAMNVLKKSKTEPKDIVSTIDMFYKNGKVWVLTQNYLHGHADPTLEVFDAESNEQVMDTKAFTSKYPELGSGISGVQFRENQNCIIINTKDGQENLIYSFDKDKVYKDRSTFDQEMEKSTDIISVPVLGGESGSTHKMKLFKVTGPGGLIITNMPELPDWVTDEEALKSHDRITGKLMSDKIYLDAMISYYDSDCAIILHPDQIGDNSNRLLTCIDIKSGEEKWSIQPDDFFKEMHHLLPFVSRVFSKDNIKVKRSGNLVVIGVKGWGLVGFDFNTGKKLWTLDI